LPFSVSIWPHKHAPDNLLLQHDFETRWRPRCLAPFCPVGGCLLIQFYGSHYHDGVLRPLSAISASSAKWRLLLLLLRKK
jgi:hypothetical protein